jgi:hypothetical protein
MLAEILAKGKNIQPSSTTQDDKGLTVSHINFPTPESAGETNSWE